MEREINLDEVVKYLSHAFVRAVAKSGVGSTRGTRTKQRNGEYSTTKLYDYQVEFCYIMDNVTRGPRYISTKNIQLANELIERLENEGGLTSR